MIRILKIVVFVWMLLFVAAPSCHDEQEEIRHEEDLLEDSRKEIRQEFESDYLSEASLFSYETRAKQMVADFYDYLRIVSDSMQPVAFRLKAAEMIENIFIPNPIIINLVVPDPSDNIPVEMGGFLDRVTRYELIIPAFIADSIVVIEPVQRKGNNRYSGRLSYWQNAIKSNQIAGNEKTVDVFLEREIKIFGTDTMNVWNVRLGSIW